MHSPRNLGCAEKHASPRRAKTSKRVSGAILSGLSDAGELAAAAHRLKGTAGLFGLAGIAGLGGRVSEAVRNGQDIGPLLTQLRETIVASRAAVANLLSNSTDGQLSDVASPAVPPSPTCFQIAPMVSFQTWPRQMPVHRSLSQAVAKAEPVPMHRSGFPSLAKGSYSPCNQSVSHDSRTLRPLVIAADEVLRSAPAGSALGRS